MKLVISPAKSLDFESALPTSQYSEAAFLEASARINNLLRKKSAKSLSKLMAISPELGSLNFERNKQWSLPFTPENARPAIFSFSGEVYRGFDAYSYPVQHIDKLQNTVRILSGLYGILKPLDLIQPYRLEMGTRFPLGKHKTLPQFWQKHITTYLNNELEPNELFLNLASAEYFKAIAVKDLKTPVITAHFKDFKNGEYKMIMTFAKQARGAMARYILDHNAQTVEDIKTFNSGGYVFSNALSTSTELVFTR